MFELSFVGLLCESHVSTCYETSGINKLIDIGLDWM